MHEIALLLRGERLRGESSDSSKRDQPPAGSKGRKKDGEGCAAKDRGGAGVGQNTTMTMSGSDELVRLRFFK